MSNYTTFFPSATGGGSTEITDPDKIPKVTAIGYSTQDVAYMFSSISQNGTTFYNTSSSNNPYLGSSTSFRQPSGGIVSQTTDNTEITLANVTSGSGYLCCVVTPTGDLGATQELKITIDGGTEKVYTYDYSSNTSSDNYYQRLIYGFSAWGSPNGYNLVNDSTATGFLGMGGCAFTFNDFTYPPMITPLTNDSTLRLFSAQEFKNYGLPKLRFESSILVKCKVNGLYSTSGYNSKGTAVYYLDSQL
jgi:hypothetical protein